VNVNLSFQLTLGTANFEDISNSEEGEDNKETLKESEEIKMNENWSEGFSAISKGEDNHPFPRDRKKNKKYVNIKQGQTLGDKRKIKYTNLIPLCLN